MKLGAIGLYLLIVTVEASESTKSNESEILNRVHTEQSSEKVLALRKSYNTKTYKTDHTASTKSISVYKEIYNFLPKGGYPHNEPTSISKSKITDKKQKWTTTSYRNTSSATKLKMAIKGYVLPELSTITESNCTFSSITEGGAVSTRMDINTKTFKSNPTAEVPIIKPRGNTENMNTCYHIDVPKFLCPEGFYSIPNQHCTLIKKNQAFPLACPYPHFLPYEYIVNTIDTYYSNEAIWIQAFRNVSNGFPHFTYFENGYLYGKAIDHIISNSDHISDRNCLIRKNRTVYRVSCSERYTTLCMYSFEKIIRSTALEVCQKEQHYCIFADYDLTQPTCFCQVFNKLQPPKSNFCEKLAEPTSPFQTQLLLTAAEKGFVKGGSKCWIGLQKEEPTGIYKWSSTNEIADYTKWAKPYNCKYSEGAIQFGKYDFGGWILVKDRTLGCAFCETKARFEEPRLFFQLQRNYEGYNKLWLYVENVYAISNFNTNQHYDIYCFTDDGDYSFLKKLNYVSYIGDVANYTIFELNVATDRPSHYWCEAFQFSSFAVVRSDMIVTHWMYDYAHEFSIHVKVKFSSETDPFIDNLHVKICEELRKQIEIEYDTVISVRPMRAYFNESTDSINFTTHLSIKKASKTATEEYNNLFRILSNISIITGFFSSEVCPATTTSTPNDIILEWPETPIGATTIPSNILCLDEEHSMLPVTRKCEGDFLNGGKWGEPLGTCFRNTTYSATTEELFNLLNQTISAENLTTNLLRITEEYINKQSIDIYLLSKNLEKLAGMSEEEIDGTGYARIISNIMHFDQKTLNDSQFPLNSTDKILSTLDSFLNNHNSTTIVSSRLIIQIIDLQDSNIKGVGLFKETPDANSFEQYKLSLLFNNITLENLARNAQLEIAAFLPSSIPNKNQTNKLVVTAFYNDLLFNEEKSVYDVTKIISISIPGVTGLLKQPLQILFKIPNGYFKDKSCSNWQYGRNLLAVSTHGQWKIDELSKARFGSFELCEFLHMTHFGLLLNNAAEGHERPLKIITAIGSSLSLIGIIPIYATAVFFKNWRKRPGNIILINFCSAITLQITLIFLLYAIEKDGILCKTVGVLLHYSIISEFCWMLVIAILQYKRYVVVFKPREANILKKSLFFGWGIPLFPIIIILCMSPNNYAVNEQNFCYITGHYFNFGFILPIVVILTINTIIFIMILHNISQSTVTICVERSRNYKREILLAFLLFFILGISWLFGLLGAYGAGMWFTYMFCITATLRGLVLFLYFITGNKETRLLWTTRSKYFLNKLLLNVKSRHNIYK